MWLWFKTRHPFTIECSVKVTYWKITWRWHLLVLQEVHNCDQVSLEALGSGVSAAPVPWEEIMGQIALALKTSSCLFSALYHVTVHNLHSFKSSPGALIKTQIPRPPPLQRIGINRAEAEPRNPHVTSISDPSGAGGCGQSSPICLDSLVYTCLQQQVLFLTVTGVLAWTLCHMVPFLPSMNCTLKKTTLTIYR